MQSVRPKKSLGQHFLNDNTIAKRIADTIDGFPQLPVLEVGPGTGVLTRFLVEKDRDLTVVELDRDSVAYLKQNFTDLQHDRIIEADFLQLDLAQLYDEKFCIIGNYPYNISSQIFFTCSNTATMCLSAQACSSARWPNVSPPPRVPGRAAY